MWIIVITSITTGVTSCLLSPSIMPNLTPLLPAFKAGVSSGGVNEVKVQ